LWPEGCFRPAHYWTDRCLGPGQELEISAVSAKGNPSEMALLGDTSLDSRKRRIDGEAMQVNDLEARFMF
jgi:hypothetical protein